MMRSLLGLLEKQRIVAGPGFNRWLVPPAALVIHLCIGMAYGFSVFWLPLSQALGIHEPVPCAADDGFLTQLFTTTCDWHISTLGWMYTLFFVFLGCSAAVWGGGSSVLVRARRVLYPPFAGVGVCFSRHWGSTCTSSGCWF